MSLTFHTCLLHCGSGFRVALRRAVIVFSGTVGIRQGFTRSDGSSEHSFFPFLAARFLLRSPGFFPIPHFPCLPDPSALSHGALCFLSLPSLSSPFSLLSHFFLTSLPHISVSLSFPLSCTHALFGASFRHLLSQKDLWPLFGRLWLTAVRFSQLSSVPFRQTVHSASEPPARTPNQPRPGLPVSPPSFLETVGDQPISFS